MVASSVCQNACHSHLRRPFQDYFHTDNQTKCFNMLTILWSISSLFILFPGTGRTNKVSTDFERYGQTNEK